MARTPWSLGALVLALIAAPPGATAQERAGSADDAAISAIAGESAYSAVAQAPQAAKGTAVPADGAQEASQAKRSRTAAVGAGETWDPIQPLNRSFFSFNDGFDVYVLEPTARGWKVITPQFVRNGVDNFFTNLQFPLRFFGCLTQGRLVDTGSELARFVVNTTAGIAGFFDPATKIGLELHDEDPGQSLGVWGVGPGPYLVLPFLGSTSTRDLVNLPFSFASSLLPGLNAINLVNTRSSLLVEVRDAKALSLDYYVFVRNAYSERRRALVLNGQQSSEESDNDLYELKD